MKSLPTTIVSPARDTAIEVLSFGGAHAIENRDAVGYYYHVRLSPGVEPSRLAVQFSGRVMAVRPDAFGLPATPDRSAAMRIFAEAAIGDYLDERGLPDHTPSGTSAAKIDCFSPHFQTWLDRPAATDDEIERYLSAHVFWAWKFSAPTWTIGTADLLRLHQPLSQVLRLARLHNKDSWLLSDESSSGARLTPEASFLRAQRGPKTLRVRPPESEPDPVVPESAPADYVYVDESRIAELRRVESADFDLRKLIALCEELNQCYRAQCYHAVAALTRAVVDHVAPVFSVRLFAEVANNYAGTRSFKDSMRRLDEAARKIADAHLHTAIRNSETLPTRVQVNFSNDIDVLLSEIIRLLQPKSPP